MAPTYSVVIPVYNRPAEVSDLLESLSMQTHGDFEVLVVDDGSEVPCRDVVEEYTDVLNVRYFYKKNTGPGDTRNYGMNAARAGFLLIFDSDCILPPEYFDVLTKHLKKNDLDAFGGPDRPHPSFSTLQRAIGHTMTSFLTTGGIRGKRKALQKFHPRSFNMGMKKAVFEQTGGFSEVLLAEDTDLSIRMHGMGFRIALVPECYVYHKRRISFAKFFRQTHHFGYGRAILTKNYPSSFKILFLVPAAFLFYTLAALAVDLISGRLLLLWPVLLFLAMIFIEALVKQKDLVVAALSVPSAIVQLFGYGYGTVKGFFELFVLRRSRYLSRGDNPLKKAL